MNRKLPREDTLPWYRQFWPWFLILLPASVVVAGLTTVYIANRGADDLVVDDYYKDGLAINRKLEKTGKADELGLSARLEIDQRQIRVLTEGPIEASVLQLSLSHPLESDQDFTLSLQISSPGDYRGQLPADIAPRWHWVLESTGEPLWRLDGAVIAADFSTSKP